MGHQAVERRTSRGRSGANYLIFMNYLILEKEIVPHRRYIVKIGFFNAEALEQELIVSR